MIVHEIEYQEDKPSNMQERYLDIESFELLRECLFGKYVSHPMLTLPIGCNVNLNVDGCIRWKRRDHFDRTIVGMAYIVQPKDVRNGVYICEVRTEK